jgi:putative membrane protein
MYARSARISAFWRDSPDVPDLPRAAQAARGAIGFPGGTDAQLFGSLHFFANFASSLAQVMFYGCMIRGLDPDVGARRQSASHVETGIARSLLMLPSLTHLPAFLAYFGTALALVAGFLLVYLNATPYDEIALIRSGNTAAAASLVGSLLGFVMPVANVIAHSDSLLDLLAWGAIAGVVQILAYLVARFALPQLTEDLPAGKMAPALFLAGLSLSVGIINAACMGY